MNKKQSMFLETEYPVQDKEKALFHIIPAPLESSVSYGGGTSNGPDAIIAASNHLEIWDGCSVPGDKGIYTHRKIESEGDTEKFLSDLSDKISYVMKRGKIPVVLGGEHTVSVAAWRAFKKSGRNIGIIQFDAHGDLRDIYENNPMSHACVMKKAHDLGFRIFQVGCRSLSEEDVKLRNESDRISFIDAREAVENNIKEIILPEDFPEEVFITFDVDGLDPSVISATGTPEPGGLSWYQVLSMIESVSDQRSIIGFDVVELAPVNISLTDGEFKSGSHPSDFAAARLVYNIMGIIDRKKD